MKRKQGFRYPAFFVCHRAGGAGAGGAEPTRPDTPRPDTPRHPPTRHPDTPTPRGKLGGCKRMQADAKGEKPMQADARGCKRKSKEVGGKESGQGAKRALTSPKGAKGRSLGGFSVVSCCCVCFSAKALLRLWLGCALLPL